MVSIIFTTPHEMAQAIALKARAKRLAFNWSQQTLSARSGVSYGVLKKFEQTGQISLPSLLKLALALDAMPDFQSLFAPKKPAQALSLDELMKDDSRQRGRK